MSSIEIDDSVITPLQRTRGWVLLLGGMSGLLALVMFAAGPILIASGGTSPKAPWIDVALAILYAFVGLLYVPVATLLIRYGRAIDDLRPGAPVSDLAGVLTHQRNFWRYVGLVLLVMITLYVLSLVAIVALTMIGAAAS